MLKTYNQNTNDFTNDCTVFSLNQILKLQYGVDIKYSMIDKVVDLALKVGVLLKWGAVFGTIYKWYANKISKTLDLDVIVSKKTIQTAGFEQALERQEYFGLYLIHGNKAYLDAVDRGILTREVIDEMVIMGGGFKHNNVYGTGVIYEIAKGKEVQCDLDTLRYGVIRGVFGSYGRTLIGGDTFTKDVGALLKIWKDNYNYDPILDEHRNGNTEYAKKIMNKAGQILLDYEIKDDSGEKRVNNLMK